MASHRFAGQRAARVLVTINSDGEGIPSEEKRAPQARLPGEIAAFARELKVVEAGPALPR